MEMNYYKCSTCGFMHQVPAYWSDYSPEQEIVLEHVDLSSKELCGDTLLRLVEGLEK